MLVTTHLHRRLVPVLASVLIVFSLTFLYRAYHLYPSDKLSQWPHAAASGLSPTTEPLDEPSDYRAPAHRSEDTCATRFSTAYLEGLRNRTGSYCTPGSRSSLTCFHTKARDDEPDDSFCIGRGAVLDPATRKFHLDCALRKLEPEEVEQGILPFNRLRGYMYDTGPRNVFRDAVIVRQETGLARRSGETAVSEALDAEHMHLPASSDSSDGAPSSVLPPPKTYLLLKREGETNPWHCLMEIFSTYMTFDVLRMSRDPSRGGAPFFATDEADDTQVVILDSREDGPFFDLWTLFARRRPVRLAHLLSRAGNNNADDDDAAAVDAVRRDANIIVPLAGGSNPLWREEWHVQPCHAAPLVDVFSSRIRGFYGVEDPPVRGGEEPIVVTLIDRRETRRLKDQAALLAALGKRGLHIRVQAVDFAALSFPDQLRVARETDVLVGVHGAGLTHVLFMRRGAGAVVEIQPDGLDQKGYRNVANLLDLGYFRIHGAGVSMPVDEADKDTEEEPGKEREMDSLKGVETETQGRDNSTNTSTATGVLKKRGDWHFMDVQVDEARFLDVVETAVKFMYNKALWSYDVNG
ncbi:hypothetical protein SODALDRAFT_326763 [Sodiomyces alkalinus F11]|uniref:EGF domain-specific O-linked N-acetylglucosamine transferase n=1 Tax=Sodiomyces alkalinus (strain CBS 110278 / VKM F-3762 / F11) TaxID=1314773 RepID=A0A3N2Q766_SODAK|nr:hypothetical protein SODALDRAFT_326763 [Sodiomyces alkalinus F11]ROT42604.1 hypothetical protein SODALDRAFT_326763 [Sodiomyces alkalinus F11]